MAGHVDDYAGPHDDREHLYLQDEIFITRQFTLETCDEGYSWSLVTEAQRERYWDAFMRAFVWDPATDAEVRRVWHQNSAILYRRLIHRWRGSGRRPDTIPATRWASWIDVWNSQAWKDKAGKNKANRASEPAGVGTGTCKHLAGSKTYNAHYHSMRTAQPETEPTTWDLFQHTHRRADGTFVDERSRFVNQSMATYLDEHLTPQDDGTIPERPSSDEVNNMFHHVVGGKKKGRMYGCGSMATSMFPQQMAPRKRGGSSGSSSSSAEATRLREEMEQQGRVIEFMRVDLMESQKAQAAQAAEMTAMREQQTAEMAAMREQISLLLSGTPQFTPPVHPDQPGYRRPVYERGHPVRGRAFLQRNHSRRIASSSRTIPGGQTLRIIQPGQRSTQQRVDPSLSYGRHDDDEDDDDDDDDDETQAP